MAISAFFLELRSAYQAELDDMYFDSDGQNVLQRRLNEKRQELDFLLQLMDLNPEMVAVVLHQAFRFTVPAVMEHFLTHNDDELLAWDSLQHALTIEPWAQPLVTQILQEPMGEWFMSVAAALEYMHTQPLKAADRIPEAEQDTPDHPHGQVPSEGESRGLDEDERDAQEREDAANDWLAEQGFDRKEGP